MLRAVFLYYNICMKFLYLEEIDSTNKYAKDNISKIEDKTIVYTSKQTDGRGRMERKWSYTGEDNIYASIVLKPSSKMKEIYSNLTQYLCLILSQVFEEYGIIPTIKWPNDIQINGKKISGILAEGVISYGNLEGLVLGFGVNLNSSREILDKINQPATSLNLEVGRKIDSKDFLKKVLDKFCLRYDSFIEEGFLLIREDYKSRAGFLNKEVTVKVYDKEISGVAIDITENGALKLIDKNDNEQVLLIGDIL